MPGNKVYAFVGANNSLIMFAVILGLLVLAICQHNIVIALLTLAAVTSLSIWLPAHTFRGLSYCALLYPILTMGMVVGILAMEVIRFFSEVSVWEFLFGTHWSPQGTVNDAGRFQRMFGILPLISGTLIVTVMATIVAVPLGILSALYISHFGKKKNRVISKTVVEVLAGIPSVIYGYFAFSIVAPFITEVGHKLGVNIALESALAAGIVMGIMIMPVVISTVDDVLDSVPRNLYYGALVLGSTKSEALVKIVLPVAMPGILSAALLAITRAIGETVIVLMATAVSAKMNFNPLEPVATINVQIATLITGDQDMGSLETMSAYTLGFMLLIITWILNSIAAATVHKNVRAYVD